MKKQIFTTNCLMLLSSLLLLPLFFFGQAPEQQRSFFKMRNTDFTKLIGGIQEGVRLNYNTEKTSLEGSGGKELKKAPIFFQASGSIGTTNNLSALFNQKVLPTFSGNVTAHFLLPSLSTWFYDGTFNRNFPQLQNNSITPPSISTKINPNNAGESESFKYTDELQNKVARGNIRRTDSLYTFKRFLWLSASGKYDNTKYSFYDGSRPFSDQVYEPVFNSWSGKGSFNLFLFWNKADVKWIKGIGWRPNFIYLNVSAQYGLGNNVPQLKKTTVDDISSSTVNGSITRQVLKTQTAYDGTFKEFKTFTPSFDLIFSPIKSFALNAFAEHNFINGADKERLAIDNFGSFALGIYFYGDGNTSKINIGAFIKWTKNKATDATTQQIGLRTSIPITPLN